MNSPREAFYPGEVSGERGAGKSELLALFVDDDI